MSQNIFSKDSFNRFIVYAFALHVLVLGAGILVKDFSFNANVDNEAKKLQIVRSAIRVDVVEMPRLTVQELKKTPTTKMDENAKLDNEVAPVIEKGEAQGPEESVELASLLNKLSSKQVDRPVKKAEKKQKISSDLRKELGKIVVAGNKVSKGVSVVDDSPSENLDDLNRYAAQLPSYIRPFWKLPSYLMREELQARVRVYIDRNGSLIKADIYQSSGKSEFDQRAIKAVRSVSGFPRPDESIISRLAAGDVILGFPL